MVNDNIKKWNCAELAEVSLQSFGHFYDLIFTVCNSVDYGIMSPIFLYNNVAMEIYILTIHHILSFQGHIYRLAEIIASFALAMEISTLSALASDQFASAHDRLGRNRPE